MESNAPIMKRCTLCGQEKGLDGFYKANLGKHGTTARCKPCHCQWAKENKDKANAAKKKWIDQNAEKNKQSRKEYRERNAEKLKIARRQRYLKNKEHVNAVEKAWRERNKEKCIEIRKQYAEAKADEIKEKSRQYREANREAIRERRRLAYQKDKSKAYEDRYKYRARVRNAEGAFTMQQIKELNGKQRCKCAACRQSIKKKYHIDHILPLSRGGSNYIENIQLLCPTCNMQKGAKDPVEFMQSRGFLL